MQGIINARAKVNCTSKSSANLKQVPYENCGSGRDSSGSPVRQYRTQASSMLEKERFVTRVPSMGAGKISTNHLMQGIVSRPEVIKDNEPFQITND